MRKTRRYTGYLFLGPAGEIIEIKGVKYYGGDGFIPANYYTLPRLNLARVEGVEGYIG